MTYDSYEYDIYAWQPTSGTLSTIFVVAMKAKVHADKTLLLLYNICIICCNILARIPYPPGRGSRRTVCQRKVPTPWHTPEANVEHKVLLRWEKSDTVCGRILAAALLRRPQIFLFQSCSQDCLEIARRSEFVPLLSSEHHPRLHARSKENGIHQDAAISARKKSLWAALKWKHLWPSE